MDRHIFLDEKEQREKDQCSHIEKVDVIPLTIFHYAGGDVGTDTAAPRSSSGRAEKVGAIKDTVGVTKSGSTSARTLDEASTTVTVKVVIETMAGAVTVDARRTGTEEAVLIMGPPKNSSEIEKSTGSGAWR